MTRARTYKPDWFIKCITLHILISKLYIKCNIKRKSIVIIYVRLSSTSIDYWKLYFYLRTFLLNYMKIVMCVEKIVIPGSTYQLHYLCFNKSLYTIFSCLLTAFSFIFFSFWYKNVFLQFYFIYFQNKFHITEHILQLHQKWVFILFSFFK